MIGASGGSNAGFFVLIILVFFVLWLIVVRPQRRRQSQQQRMLRDLQVGDEVLTAGGIYGEIVRLDENEVALEIAPRLEVRVARRAIAAVVTEPDLDEAGDGGEPEDSEELAEPGPEEAEHESEAEASTEEKPG